MGEEQSGVASKERLVRRNNAMSFVGSFLFLVSLGDTNLITLAYVHISPLLVSSLHSNLHFSSISLEAVTHKVYFDVVRSPVGNQ